MEDMAPSAEDVKICLRHVSTPYVMDSFKSFIGRVNSRHQNLDTVEVNEPMQISNVTVSNDSVGDHTGESPGSTWQTYFENMCNDNAGN